MDFYEYLLFFRDHQDYKPGFLNKSFSQDNKYGFFKDEQDNKRRFLSMSFFKYRQDFQTINVVIFFLNE